MTSPIYSKIKNFLFYNKTGNQTVVKNAFWLTVAEVFDKGVAFLCVVGIARHFGSNLFGEWTVALSLVSIFAILPDFGFASLTVREVAKDKTKTASYIDNILLMKAVLSVFAFLAIVITANLMGKEGRVLVLVYFLAIYVIINSFSNFFRSVFLANEKMQYDAAARIIQNLVLLTLVAVFIFTDMPIAVMCYAYIIAPIAGIAFSFGYIWRSFSKFLNKIDFRFCKEILLEAWPFALSGIFMALYGQVDVLILSSVKSYSSVGWYDAANRLTSNLAVFPSILMGALYPRLSIFYAESKDGFKKIYKKVLRYVFLLCVIMFPLLLIFSKWIILLLYGSTYSNSIIVFRILLLSSLFTFFSYVFAYILFSIKKQFVYTLIIIFCLTFNVILSLIFVPRFSYIGVSWVLVLSQFLQALLLFLATKRYL